MHVQHMALSPGLLPIPGKTLRTLLTLRKDSSRGWFEKQNLVAHASDGGSRGAPVHPFVPSRAAVCLDRPAAGTPSAKCALAAAVQPGTVHPASFSLASALQKDNAERKCSRALQKGTAEGHYRRALSKGTAEGHCRRALQKGS